MFRSASVPAFVTLLMIVLASCGSGKNDPLPTKAPIAQHATLLHAVDAEKSGITFSNTVTESPALNYFTYLYAYNGGGVAVGDIDNDGLPDIYFTGNQVPDKLYHNLGGLKFEDITEKAIGKLAGEGWRTGVSMADVNADGWLDIYVCRSGPVPDPAITRNLLYVNNGNGTFTERALEYGVADTTHSTQAAFFDADRDGDLDLIVANDPNGRKARLSNVTARAAVQAHTAPTTRYFRNDGMNATTHAPHFTDATYDVSVQDFAYTLGLSVADLDKDGAPDIYEANDFDAPDLMYINRGDGHFGEQLQVRTHHTSNFGMGCDVADFNNDALPDIITLDMTADDHVRNKTNMASMSPENFWALVRGGYFFQYMVNTLQLNNGNGTFSEIGQLAGIARTDWSWAPLFCDLDNDGWKDLIVTNGYKHDVRDNDYMKGPYRNVHTGSDFYGTLDLIPSSRMSKYAFRNNGDLTFADSSKAWGFTQAINSNGAAYADLDNDGDLDLVINNMDVVASLYENSASNAKGGNHWLRIRPLHGASPALGVKISAHTKGMVQYQELYPVRGYQSCVEPVLHFGLGSAMNVDTLEVQWPNGARTVMRDVKADQLLTLKEEDAKERTPPVTSTPTLFTELPNGVGDGWKHHENAYNDFELEPLLPHKMSELGPMLGTGDANGDGRVDLFAGNAHGQPAMLWLQRADGSFKAATSQPWAAHREQETLGSVFFDADKDGDQDLLVLAGGNEVDLRDPIYTQRLYLNDGKGNYREADNALPTMETSAQRAAAADIDGDGDMDLFIGGRQTPAHYPFAPRSYLLINDGTGHFADLTQQLAPSIMGPGMITAVTFTDIDGDKDPDLLLAGEWMNVMLLRNDGGHFTDISADAGLADTHGWWYSLAIADVNEDGHPDIIAGNLGWNSKFHGTPEHPIHIFWADFDDNGRHDIVLAKERDGKLLPVRGRECSSQQCPMIQRKFPTYKDFANADLPAIYSEEKLQSALHLQATMMRSTVFINDGHGKFTARSLPNIVQAAPINAIVPMDVNGDHHIDLVCAGNNWSAEVETVRYDAGTGLVLLGDGKGSFASVPSTRSGFFAWGNVKDLALVRTGADRVPMIVVANNNDVLQAFRLSGAPTALSAK